MLIFNIYYYCIHTGYYRKIIFKTNSRRLYFKIFNLNAAPIINHLNIENHLTTHSPIPPSYIFLPRKSANSFPHNDTRLI